MKPDPCSFERLKELVGRYWSADKSEVEYRKKLYLEASAIFLNMEECTVEEEVEAGELLDDIYEDLK